MKTMNRRDWFRSSLALSAGFSVSPALIQSLMAAPVSEAERHHGIFASGTLVRLGSNENPYGPSPRARKAIEEAIKSGNRYAFETGQELRELIAHKEGVSADHILLGAGSSEILCLAGLAAHLEGGAVLSAFPTFRLLMDYAQKFKARWDKVNLDATLTHNLSALGSAVKSDTRLVFVCNPNNPTGTIVDANTLKTFCIEMSKRTLVFMDEAYLEFLEPADQKSMVDLVRQGHNVLISRTFSKVYGLAGLRLGYAVAHPDVIRKMAPYQMGAGMNQAGIAAAKVCIGDVEFENASRRLNAEARKHLTDYLDSKKWFYGKSLTNCVFFPAPKDGKTILAETEKRGFQIRVWDYDNRECCRVSIGTLDEMKAFTKAFDEVIS
jgi:histidinol-phosphate aminotransferase